ncbi:TonB-dependent receptor [Flavobacterium sp. N502536]|uniref:TonB-dependent receptor n=1 Tax=Flavobacterium sp. N502536 TaxID=2986837 RepID=UPI002222743B|nr:TonB-dependent receptor [Flavobacterium sp. N502536]
MKIFLLLSAIFTISFTASAQKSIITGRINDNQGIPISFASISISELKVGEVADQQGVYALSVISGRYTVKVSAVGYKTTEQDIVLIAGETLHTDFTLVQDSDLDEVVVSASRKKETLDEVPSSINIIGLKSLSVQKTISNNLSEILANTVPGLGFNTNRTSNLGQTLRGRGILVMIDGVPQSTPLRNGMRDIRSIDPLAIERVEVIKGATAIYGNGADGGLINYITKKPNVSKAISGQTSIGSTGFLSKPDQTFGGYIGQQFTGKIKKFDYVVSGRFENTGVSRDAKGRVLSPEYGLNELDMWNVFAKVGYGININNRVEVMYNYFTSKQNTDYVAQAGQYGNANLPTIGVPGDRPGLAEGTPYNHNLYIHYNSERIIGETDLDVTLYLQHFYTLLSSSNFFEGNGQPGNLSKKKGLRINLNTPFVVSDNWNGNFVYGLDVLSDVTSTILTDGRVSVPEMDMRNLAPYLQVKSVFMQNLIFKAGARFENINVDVPTYTTLATRNYVTGGYSGGGIVVKGDAINYNALIFNAGLRYNKLSYFKPFVSFSQSYSLGDLGLVLRSAKENTVKELTTKAIIANNYEVGFSSTFGKLNIEAATYVSTSKLGASYVFVDGKAQIARSPETIYGFELAADYAVLDNLSLGGSYSYTEGKREINGKKVYLGGDRIGPPKTTAYVSYSPLSDWTLRLQMLSAGNRKRFDPVNGKYSYGTGPMDSFTTFSFFSNYNLDKNSSIQLGLENVFNKDYFTVPSQWMADNLSYVKGNGARFTLSYLYKF